VCEDMMKKVAGKMKPAQLALKKQGQL